MTAQCEFVGLTKNNTSVYVYTFVRVRGGADRTQENVRKIEAAWEDAGRWGVVFITMEWLNSGELVRSENCDNAHVIQGKTETETHSH